MNFEQQAPKEKKELKAEPLRVMKVNVAAEPNPFSRAISQVMDIFETPPSSDGKHRGIKFDKKSPFFRKFDEHEGEENEAEFTRIGNVLEKLRELKSKEPSSLPDVLAIICDQGLNERVRKEIRLFINELRNTFPAETESDYYPYTFVVAPSFSKTSPSDIPEADFVLTDMPQFITLLAGQLLTIPDLLDSVMARYEKAMTEYKGKFYDLYKEKIKARSKITADTEQEVNMLEGIFEKNQVEKVLDAGGGEGRIAQPLSFDGYTVVGVDITPGLVKKAKEKDLDFVVGDLKELPIKDESQDAVAYNWHVFCDVLGKPAKLKVLSEANRVLKQKGIVVLDIPDRDKLSLKKDGIYFNEPDPEPELQPDPSKDMIYIGYVPKAEEMKALLEKSGFVDIEIKEWKTEQGYPKLTFVAKKK